MRVGYVVRFVVVGLLSLVVLGVSQHVAAQPTYGFTFIPPGVVQYSELVKDIPVTFDTNGFHLISFPTVRTFSFFGVQFSMREDSELRLGSGGFVRLDNDSSLVIVDGAFTYLDSIDATSRVSYKVEDDNQSGLGRVLKYQYSHHRLRAGPEGNFMNMQIWCYEQSGVIEIHYGPRSANNASGYTTATGPNVGVFFAPHDFSKMHDKLWVVGSPNTPSLDSVRNLNFRALSGLPDEGTVYRFTPRWMTTSVDEFGQAGAEAEQWTIDVYDMLGKLRLHSTVDEPTEHLFTRELPQGVYIVRLTSLTGKIKTKVVLKDTP